MMPALLLLHAAAHAGTIAYDAAGNRVHVSGFPEETPATLSDILDADRAQDWGIITYDPAGDIFTLRAALWIGGTNDFGSFFQIGRPDHPREVLVLHGDLVVTAPRPSPQRRDGRLQIANRLTLGDPGDPEIRATVKMACATRNEFTVRVQAGAEGHPGRREPILPRGELFMFNSMLTAATPDPAHTYATAIVLSHTGINFHIADSTFAWWHGDLFTLEFTHYDRWAEPRVFRGMTFEHGGTVRWMSFADCVFRDLDVALTHGGAVRCTFENNRNNLMLHNMHTGAALLDCEIGPAARPLQVPRTRHGASSNFLRTRSSNRHARDPRIVANPGVTDRRSLPVRVLDPGGRPVPYAAVWLSSPDEPDGAAVVHRLAVTDENGETPGTGSDSALVYTAREWRPTDDPAAPEEIVPRYRLRIEAPEFPPHEIDFAGDDIFPRPWVVRLP